MLRFSPHFYNDAAEVERGLDRLLATIDRTCRPFGLRYNLALRIPLLVAAYPDHDLLQKEFESFAVRSKERLHNLDPAPSRWWSDRP